MGVPVGHQHDISILDVRTYLVVFPDGAKTEYTVHTIAEKVWDQCDVDSNQ